MAPKKKKSKEELEAERLKAEEDARKAEEGASPVSNSACALQGRTVAVVSGLLSLVPERAALEPAANVQSASSKSMKRLSGSEN